MLLVTIISNINRSYVLEEIMNIEEVFKKKKIDLNFDIVKEEAVDFINIIIDEDKYTLGVEKLLHLYISNLLYNVVINRFCEKNICKYLNETYNFLNVNDMKLIKGIIEKTLKEERNIDDTVIYCMNKKNYMIKKIMECIEDNKEINVKGFLDFRDKQLKDDINDILEKVVEGYMVEKEYNEFITLLKYFVDIQESKVEEVNIFLDSKGDYIVRDEFGNDVLNNVINDVNNNINKVGEINKDDLIISALITIAPAKIIIHGVEKYKNKEVINTIENVFENRVSYCNHCSLCDSLKIF